MIKRLLFIIIRELSDIRLVCILPVLSKLMEKVLNEQITDHLNSFNILPVVQSGFVKGRSTSTALAKVVDDIIEANDKRQLTAMVLLDYSKAFDTIVHEVLLSKLHFIGFNKNAVEFMKNYLGNRSQQVVIGRKVSQPLKLAFGVPQGSILGPVLYNIYTFDFIHNVEFCHSHFYADDTQLYKSFEINNALESINKISYNN